MGTSDLPKDHPDSDRTRSASGPGGAGGGQIGPYRLLQLLGEGGMGEVWLAEQKKPIHRTVALKLIKAGMDTKAVVARFADRTRSASGPGGAGGGQIGPYRLLQLLGEGGMGEQLQ